MLLGSGGREDALAWRLRQSPSCGKLIAAPGNPGIARWAECVSVDPCDPRAVVDLASHEGIDLVVIGPEAPLVAGVGDALRAAGFAVFGPNAAAAKLEGSKGFTKDLCRANGIPTADYVRVDRPTEARAALDRFGIPVVIKADGLAAGKGVTVAMTRAEAEAGTPFSGVLYAGLMLTAEGPKLIEYNVRFGDPECEAIMPLVDGDFAELLHAVGTGRLAEAKPKLTGKHTVTVIVAARGYPGTPASGGLIREIDAAEQVEGVTVFHAGTTVADEGLIAKGGRVLAVTAIGDTFANARARAYRAVDQIDFADGFHRRDIGWRELERERT